MSTTFYGDPCSMRHTLLVALLIGSVLGASLWQQFDFKLVNPIILDGEHQLNIKPNKSLLFSIREIDHQSGFSRLPIFLLLSIFFDFMRSKEILRLRTICKYFQRLIDRLLDHRLDTYSSHLSLLLEDPLQRLKFSCNYLPLFRVVYPVLPLQRSSLEIAQLDLLGLILVAVFANCELEVFHYVAGSLADRWLCSSRNQSVFFFKVSLMTKFSPSRASDFNDLSALLHKQKWPLSLEALYSYCKRKGNDAAKLTLLSHRLGNFQMGESFLLNEYFSSVTPQSLWAMAMKAKNGAAFDALLTAFPSLSIGISHRQMLFYLARNGIYSWKVCQELIDWPAVEETHLNELLPIIIRNRGNFLLLRDILQFASNLNPLYRILKRIMHPNDTLIDWTTFDSESIHAVVLVLAAFNCDQESFLAAFRQLLPFVNRRTAPIITYFVLNGDLSEYFKIVFSTPNFEPAFICPDYVYITYANSQLHFHHSQENPYQLSRIFRKLEMKQLRSAWWLESIHYVILSSQVNDYYFEGTSLLRLKTNIDGSERVRTSIPDLQARYRILLDGYISDVLAINSKTLLERQEWTILELAIFLLNPTAVFLCLLSPFTKTWLESDESARKSVVQLTILMRSLIHTSQIMLSRLEMIDRMVTQTLVSNNWTPVELQAILDSTASSQTNPPVPDDDYLILDSSPFIKYETKAPL